MSQIDRLIVSRGPALVTFNGGSFLSEGDIVAEMKHDLQAINSDAYGKLTDVQLGVKASLKFKPVGEFDSTAAGVLWPYAATVPGTSIFGGADHPLIIKPLDTTQKMIKFWAAGVSKMPDLTFSAKSTIIGDAEFQMVGKNNIVITDAERLFVSLDNDLDGVPYNPDNLLVQAYAQRWFSAATFTLTFGGQTTAPIAWDADNATIAAAFHALTSVTALTGPPDLSSSFGLGGGGDFGGIPSAFGHLDVLFAIGDGDVGPITATLINAPGGSSITVQQITAGVTGVTREMQRLVLASPWLGFEAREGVKIAFNMQTTDDETDAIGHYDTIFRSLEVTAKAQPQGIPLLSVLASARLQGASSIRGRKLATGAHTLRVTGENLYFLLYGAQLDGASITRSSQNQAVGELTWNASRSVGGGGAINPLFYLNTGD